MQPQRVATTFIFGGEYENPATGKVAMYNDLYKYNNEKDRWTRITSPKRYGVQWWSASLCVN